VVTALAWGWKQSCHARAAGRAPRAVDAERVLDELRPAACWLWPSSIAWCVRRPIRLAGRTG